MHKSTLEHTSNRSYSAGGARATIGKVDDGKLMQEHKANFQKGETREGIEAAQNYGFTSCNMPEDDEGSSEAFVNFIGGNRSFPAMGPADDPRHRLMGLSQGDVALNRTKNDDMQIHLAGDGMYHSAPQMVRCQLVPAGSAKKEAPQSKPQPQPTAQDIAAMTDFQRFSHEAMQATQRAAAANGGGSSSGQQQQQQKGPTGQKAVNSAGQDSKDFMHVKKDEARLSSAKQVRLSTSKDDDDVLHEASNGKNYVGGTPAKHKFSKILTLAGPSVNGFAKIG